jgi:hypothetical protein
VLRHWADDGELLDMVQSTRSTLSANVSFTSVALRLMLLGLSLGGGGVGESLCLHSRRYVCVRGLERRTLRPLAG